MQDDFSFMGPKIPHISYEEQKKRNFCSSWELDNITETKHDKKLKIDLVEPQMSPAEIQKKATISPRRGFLVNRQLNTKKNMITLLPLIKEFVSKMKDRSDKFKANSMLPYHFKIIQDLTHFDLQDEEEEEHHYKYKKSDTVRKLKKKEDF